MTASLDGTTPMTVDITGTWRQVYPGDILDMTNVRGNPSYLVVHVREVKRRQPAPGERRFALRVMRNPAAEEIEPDALNVDIHRHPRPPRVCAFCGGEAG